MFKSFEHLIEMQQAMLSYQLSPLIAKCALFSLQIS